MGENPFIPKDDPLMKPIRQDADISLLVKEFFDMPDRVREEVTINQGSSVLVSHSQRESQYNNRGMDFALFSPGRLSFGVSDYVDAVQQYYVDVDNSNLGSIQDLFHNDSNIIVPYIFKRNSTRVEFPDSENSAWFGEFDADVVSQGTTYLRCDDKMMSWADIAAFYSPEGRKLNGEHKLRMICATPGYVMAFGKFNGVDQNSNEIEIEFGDVWNFRNDSLKVAERRTYLSQPVETLAIKNDRSITYEDLLNQTTHVIDIRGIKIFEIVGFPHSPDLGHLGYKIGSEEKHYFNIGGESIK